MVAAAACRGYGATAAPAAWPGRRAGERREGGRAPRGGGGGRAGGPLGGGGVEHLTCLLRVSLFWSGGEVGGGGGLDA